MTVPIFEIRPFHIKNTNEAYSALNRHANLMRRERLPDDPSIPLDETIQNLKTIPNFVDLRLWAAWNTVGSEIVGFGQVVFLRLEENQHLSQFDISVLPEYRRQGLGRQILNLIAEAAQQENRRLLVTGTVDRIPGGAAFMERVGAKKAMEAHTNQLRIDELNQELIYSWLARSQGTQNEFDLGFWDGPYPEDQLLPIAELTDLTNTQPHGDLEIEDIHTTPEQLRAMENNIFARGNQRWTFYLVHRATGKFAGYTETVWNPNRPEILRQDMTAVFPQFRNLGLGRWLKAAMIDKVLKERPQVKYVRTGNADSNAAMLKINTQMGFKPYMADTFWQVELQKVLDYLHPPEEATKEEPHA